MIALEFKDYKNILHKTLYIYLYMCMYVAHTHTCMSICTHMLIYVYICNHTWILCETQFLFRWQYQKCCSISFICNHSFENLPMIHVKARWRINLQFNVGGFKWTFIVHGNYTDASNSAENVCRKPGLYYWMSYIHGCPQMMWLPV